MTVHCVIKKAKKKVYFTLRILNSLCSTSEQYLQRTKNLKVRMKWPLFKRRYKNTFSFLLALLSKEMTFECLFLFKKNKKTHP